jgi:hypothetical protein
MANRKKKPEYKQQPISISLSADSLSKLDELRDMVPRSTYIAILIRDQARARVAKPL